MRLGHVIGTDVEDRCATQASSEIVLAATAGHFIAAEVIPAATAAVHANVSAEPHSCDKVAVESNPTLATTSADVTGAAEVATHAPDETNSQGIVPGNRINYNAFEKRFANISAIRL